MIFNGKYIYKWLSFQPVMLVFRRYIHALLVCLFLGGWFDSQLFWWGISTQVVTPLPFQICGAIYLEIYGRRWGSNSYKLLIGGWALSKDRGGLTTKPLPSQKLTVRTSKDSIPKENDRFPTIHFQGVIWVSGRFLFFFEILVNDDGKLQGRLGIHSCLNALKINLIKRCLRLFHHTFGTHPWTFTNRL